MAARLTLQRALSGTVAAAILLGVVPAGVALDRRLVSALIAKARSDLEMAPHVLADRTTATTDMLRMHAGEVARAPGLAAALARDDRPAVRRLAEQLQPGLGDGVPLVVSADGTLITGPRPDPAWVAATRRGASPVVVGLAAGSVYRMALMPVTMSGRWTGAVGVAEAVDARSADALARLTRSDVTLLVGPADSLAVTTLDSLDAEGLRHAFATLPDTGVAHDVTVGPRTYFAVAAPLGDAARVIFSRGRDAELAVIPELHRVALLSAIVALGIALLLGALIAARVTRPARELAGAATAMARGSFDVPLPRSRIREVALIAEQFDEMRRTLARQMAELRTANDALTDRNARLSTLQNDLMQRDRLAATGRLVAQLAHEIRNPVANLRNLLELVRRRLAGDAQGAEYADLAIDELLRMHELAERMLDLNRPGDPAARGCAPMEVADEVARLAMAGVAPETLRITVTGDAGVRAAMAPDALKQVLVNLVQNAREAVGSGEGPGAVIGIDVRTGRDGVSVSVTDNGPGVPEPVRRRIFDPFFTTKSAMDGVGLGLFVAEGLVRSAGGRLSLDDARRHGARFVIDLLAGTEAVGTSVASSGEGRAT